MNVFEELIGELKDENLLEDTVIQVRNGTFRDAVVLNGKTEFPSVGDLTLAGAGPVALDSLAFETNDEMPDEDKPEFKAPVDDREFFRKRAMEEVSSLQMVEHVLAGVEREHMKMAPAAYDELEIKKALHRFLQVSGDVTSEDHADAVYKLLQETQGWHTALSASDKSISVANIRQFCENSRPVLSSQALMALARFYRNSPFSEAVRGKFDFVMTRLFSREIGDEKRKLLFGRIEMVAHVGTLYSNWASVSISADEDLEGVPSVVSAVAGFEAFVRESDAVESFDQLIASDFFNRIRLVKENTAELFYEAAV